MPEELEKIYHGSLGEGHDDGAQRTVPPVGGRLAGFEIVGGSAVLSSVHSTEVGPKL